MSEWAVTAKIIFIIVQVIVSVLCWKTHDLDGVKDAWVYRTSYALFVAQGMLYIAQALGFTSL